MLSTLRIVIERVVLCTLLAALIAGCGNQSRTPVRSPVTIASPPTHGAAVSLTTPAFTEQAETATASTDSHRVTLDEMWLRMQQLEFAPVLDGLTILPKRTRNDPFFGVADAINTQDASAPILRGSGAATDRLEIRWDQIEQRPGVYDFSTLNAELNEAQQLRFMVIGLLLGTPTWAASSPSAGAASPPRGLGPPRSDARQSDPWIRFVRAAVQAAGSRVTVWEIWNEPNSQTFWTGTPAQYAELYLQARSVIHSLDPAAPVLIGGMVSDNGAWLRAIVDTICSEMQCPSELPQDVAWHVYDNPHDILRLKDLIRAVFATWHVTPRLWITESNVPVVDPGGPANAVTGPDSVTLAEGGAFIVQVLTLAHYAGYRTVVIYRAADVDDQEHYWGLIQGDLTARPAFYAFRTTAAELHDTRPLSLTHPVPGVTAVAFCRGTTAITVVWNDSNQVEELSLPGPSSLFAAMSMTGQQIRLMPHQHGISLQLPGTRSGDTYRVALGTPVFIRSSTC
ncbi:MAG: hypothetical protein M1118_06130 [Chloroflexi bacterium]|nr:hypothetical protein [Chloroflexota bacterium]